MTYVVPGFSRPVALALVLGNVYTGEVEDGKRVQKFVPVTR